MVEVLGAVDVSDDLWVTIVGGLVVAVSTWILGVVHGQWKERSREGKDRRAITAALRMEIAANLTELEAVWSEIHRPPSVQEQTVAPHPEVDILPAVRLEPVMDLRRRSRVIEGSRGHQRPGDESVSRAQSSAYALRPGIIGE